MNGEQQTNEKHAKSHSLLHKALFFFAITLVLLAALWVVNTYVFTKSLGYQAVFLTNGDVYFGHLERNIGRDYLRLTNVYYLQIDQAAQGSDAQDFQNTQFSLIKLGKEIHGPQDEMLINKDHVMFIENLRADSQVVQTIESR